MKLSEYGNYPDLTQAKRVLVILFRNIGDVILTTPVFTALKKQYPHLEVDALVDQGTESMLVGNPNIREVHIYNRKAKQQGLSARLKEELRLFKLLRAGNYDVVVSLTPGDRSQLLSWITKAPVRVGAGKIKKLFRRPMLTHRVRHPSAGRHYVERHLDCVRRIGVFPDEQDRCPVLYEPEQSIASVKSMLEKNQLVEKGYILLHPTSRWMFKCWPIEKMTRLINRLQESHDLPVVITSAPDLHEKEYIEQMLSGVKRPVVNLSGLLNLTELISLVRNAKVFIGVDSAPMHMAAATQTPAVALFGPSSEVDWGPWGELHTVVSMNEFTCRPCQIDGCGGSKRSECLENLPEDKVWEAVQETLKRTG